MLEVLTVGADPEVFFQNKAGKPISVEGKLGGTKKKPLPILNKEGMAIQEDNVAAEYNVPPARTAAEFDRYVSQGLRYIRGVAKAQKLKVAVVAALEFPVDQLMTYQTMTFGCDPDYNAWTEDRNQPPDDPTTPLRTAAGHVHVGYRAMKAGTFETCGLWMIKALDLMLGVPSLLVTPKTARRSMYGKAGAFRPKPYGVEYRTLDNFWIDHKEYREHIFAMVHRAANNLQCVPNFEDILEFWRDEIQEAINGHDLDLASKIIHATNTPMFPVIVSA